jgi:8-oxo-dGTP diphosphatase
MTSGTSPTSPLPTRRLRHPGPNPAADLVLLRASGASHEVLLIRRALSASADPGKWALPGGFVDTNAAAGEPWAPDLEAPAHAALRELHEEAGLDLTAHEPLLAAVGTYEGGGRDPRDTTDAWVRSHVFALRVDEATGRTPIVAQDDAEAVQWHAIDALPPLAFDHARILADAFARLDLTR